MQSRLGFWKVAVRAMLIFGGACVSCGQPQGEQEDSACSSVLDVQVDPVVANGVVSNSGSCTPVVCTTPYNVGDCIEWKGKMLIGNGATCTVSFVSATVSTSSETLPVATCSADGTDVAQSAVVHVGADGIDVPSK